MTDINRTIETAFILGAGLGTRMLPLTETCPKPLLPVAGRPIITYAMDHLLEAGVKRFIVNTHHQAQRYSEIFPKGEWRGKPIIFRHEPVLLNTGGGLKNIEDLLTGDEVIWVYNGDIMTDLPLKRLLEGHMAGGKEVTLALRSTGAPRNVSLDSRGAICDFRFVLGAKAQIHCLFTGIYIVSRFFLRRLEAGGKQDIVSIFIDMVREQPGAVGGVIIDEGEWDDIGSPEAYEKINEK
ncbi:MAG: nucleotidyltransferase family protein [Syntrophus sp. SKADARSKE-3]|nr:nucleotidyltransferase family protein [Syntrophus sp. SKADARSKE-3]